MRHCDTARRMSLISVFGLIIFFERAFDLYVARSLSTDRFIKVALGAVKAREFSTAITALLRPASAHSRSCVTACWSAREVGCGWTSISRR